MWLLKHISTALGCKRPVNL